MGVRRKIRRRLEVIRDDAQTQIVASGRTAAQPLCQQCKVSARMLPFEEAALLYQVAPATVREWLQSGKLHYLQRPVDSVFICLQSLEELAAQERRRRRDEGR